MADQQERRRQRDRDRIREKRLLDKVRYTLGGKTRTPAKAGKLKPDATGDILEETILTPAVKPQKPRKSPRMVTINRG